MRSKILEELLANTPKWVEKKVDIVADIHLAKLEVSDEYLFALKLHKVLMIDYHVFVQINFVSKLQYSYVVLPMSLQSPLIGKLYASTEAYSSPEEALIYGTARALDNLAKLS